VQVWHVFLIQPETVRQRLEQILSTDEQARASKFYFERDKRGFIVGRGMLRMLLGAYLNIAPERLHFCYGDHGKPALVQKRDDGKILDFNVSHTKELAVFAFSWNRELGVDVEYIRTMQDADSIAKRFFSAREYEVLQTLPASQKMQGFFNCWTRKEAYLKALGDGLARPLDEFEVSLVPGEAASLLHVVGRPEETSRWRLEAFTPAPGYVAAIAGEGPNWLLQLCRSPLNLFGF
jgi:4'-phosphopantetheinyl transferase